MILVDVNILVYAFRDESPDHGAYRGWLDGVVNSPTEIAVTEATLVGFVRIVTHPRIYAPPASTPAALEFANAIARSPRCRWLSATPTSWDEFDDIVSLDRGVKTNLVPDAWLAAVAITNGCRLATADRGFARFRDLDWFDPVAA